MDFTPKNDDPQDSGIVSASFGTSSRVFESTPKTEIDSTPHIFNNNPKKRKACFADKRGKKLTDLLESCPSTPQFSSTLNESFTRHFENIKLNQSYDCDSKIVTPPLTPESKLKPLEKTPRKADSFQKCSSTYSTSSPLKEQHKILYSNLKPLDPVKKPLTPQKFKERIGQNSNPRSLFVTRDNRLFSRILSNNVIMGKIFDNVSNGDLFRVSMVSKSFRDALYSNGRANQRFKLYRECHKKNKENYKITPPSSPESQNMFSAGSVSPNSQKFREFFDLGINLDKNQSLIKCPRCGKPSIVQKSIAQCQDVNKCGYIFCQKCDSFGFNPEEFVDRCEGSMLLTSKRRKLEDLSNSSLEFNGSSIFTSTFDYNYQSSGYFSGNDSMHSPISVKRNLSKSFGINESLKPAKALFESNRTSVKVKKMDKRRTSGCVIPVVQNENGRKKIEIVEPSSPPKVKMYSACSKQSKRNLKRLTR